MPSKKPETVARVRRRDDVSPVFIHGYGVIAPGEYTEAIPLDEARQRADFEVVAVPIDSAPEAEDPIPATSEKEEH